jgi:DNA-binding response OmpR family regulator
VPEPPTVLIVADEEADCRVVIGALRDQPAYNVVGPLAALEALRFCSHMIPAVVLLHVELRDITAGELCTLIRGRANGTRVATLFFGASRGARDAAASAFGAADEYISQADAETISARVDALTRPTTADNDERPIDRYRGRHLEAHFDRVEIIVDRVRIDLTRRELALLQFLVTYANRVLGRADLLGHVWRHENDGRSRTVDVHIRRLRVKLGAAGKQIQTVPGVGYRFSED